MTRPDPAAAALAESPAADAPRGFGALAEAFSALGIEPTVVEHAPAFTVEDSRTLRGTIPGVHTKNLFLKDKKGSLFLITAPEDAQIDLKRIHSAIGARGRVSFGSAQTMASALGITPGSVSPLALINDAARAVRCILHKDVAEAALVNVHPLRNTATVTLMGAAFHEFLRHIDHEPIAMDLIDAA